MNGASVSSGVGVKDEQVIELSVLDLGLILTIEKQEQQQLDPRTYLISRIGGNYNDSSNLLLKRHLKRVQ